MGIEMNTSLLCENEGDVPEENEGDVPEENEGDAPEENAPEWNFLSKGSETSSLLSVFSPLFIKALTSAPVTILPDDIFMTTFHFTSKSFT
jgi:hypothetical protein